MVNDELVRTIVGVIGNVISFGLFASPIPTFIKICKDKSVNEFKPDPYLATVINCMLWTFYGMPFVHPDSLLVITINATGVLMEMIYVSIFFIYSPWPKQKKIILTILGELVFMALVVIIVLHFVNGTKARSMVVGTICLVFNVVMYAAPLTVMRIVIKTKSVKYMPFFLSLANFCNGIIWVIYALLKFDLYVLIPNALGTLSGLVQLILFATYYGTTKWDEEPKPLEFELDQGGTHLPPAGTLNAA
ncbi:hypothetical protein ACFE04_019178 [Oxalis oulophora]